MGRELMHIYPSFAKIIHQCDNLLTESGFPGCLQIINSDKPAIESVDEISILQAFQSAIFALEVALAKLLISWNIVPTAVLGHR
jgi:acyl transferase domain-containing protein